MIVWQPCGGSAIRRRNGVIAFARRHAVVIVMSSDFNFAEASVPIRILRIVAKAVLVMQLF